MTRYRDMEHRLVANSYVCEETGCWVWTGYADDAGYGRITIRVASSKGKPKRPVCLPAHRVAYQVLKGVILEPEETVDHACPCGPRKLCIFPDHMQVVSRSYNTRLQWARRRFQEIHQTRAPF